jgi:hypothetical protein
MVNVELFAVTARLRGTIRLALPSIVREEPFSKRIISPQGLKLKAELESVSCTAQDPSARTVFTIETFFVRVELSRRVKRQLFSIRTAEPAFAELSEISLLSVRVSSE